MLGMRESESIALSEFYDLLESLPEVSSRILVTQTEPGGSGWTLQAAALTAVPSPSAPEWTFYNYGHIAFIADLVPGAKVAKWFSEGKGESAGLHFEVPELQEPLRTERLPSHARYRYFDGLWQPHTYYELYLKSHRFEPPRERPPLIQDGCPSFPALGAAVHKLLFDVELDRRSDWNFPSPPITLRISHTEAWIERVEQYPSSLIINVQGDAVKDVRLEITGSKSVLFDQKLSGSGDVHIDLPEGLPPWLWVLLSRKDRWLDLRDLNQYGSRSPWDNVIDVPADLATQVAGAIARGEGARTEFKEQIPYGSDKFLNVVAAFANGEGGMIVVGVVDRTGEIKGLTCDLDELKSRLTLMIRDKIFPEPKTRIESCEVNGRRLVAVIVEEGDTGPYGVGSDRRNLRYYVRRGATTPPASQDEIRAAARKGSTASNTTYADF